MPYYFHPRALEGQAAKPGSYITLTIEYRGAPARIEVYMPEKTAWYSRMAPWVEPSYASIQAVEWETDNLLVDVGIYLLNTWGPGQVVSVTPRVRLPTGEVIEQRVSWTTQGGTPTMAPVWTPTPTRTPEPSAAVWGPGWTWITPSGPVGPDLVFLVTTEGALREGDVLNFCDADFSCCSWVDIPGGPTWGWMRITRLSNEPGCAEWRWVWVDHPVSVQRVEWRTQ